MERLKKWKKMSRRKGQNKRWKMMCRTKGQKKRWKMMARIVIYSGG